MKKYIIILCLGLLAHCLQAQDVNLRYNVTTGVHDTVLVYAKSATTSAVDMSAITTSVLFTNGGQVQGYESLLAQQWGGFAALTQVTTSINKGYNGVSYDGMWQMGIAAIGNTAITIPASNATELLIFKVWFSGATSPDYYLEDKAESLGMNEIESSTNGELTFTVLDPGAGSLPVEILSFEATAEDREVTLDWVTETETNNAGFEIERSQDARSFEKLAWVNGEGTTNAPTSYNYVDADTRASDVFYYRLKQFDLNGSFEYSNIVEIRLESVEQAAVSNLYPNPADNMTRVQLEVTRGGNIQWNVLNMVGQVVKKGSLSMAEGETREFELNVSDLEKGNYLVRFAKENDWTITRKLVVH